MTLTELTTALHRWADKHGGKFPDAILCSHLQYDEWVTQSMVQFDVALHGAFKGVHLECSDNTECPILFASSPLD